MTRKSILQRQRVAATCSATAASVSGCEQTRPVHTVAHASPGYPLPCRHPLATFCSGLRSFSEQPTWPPGFRKVQGIIISDALVSLVQSSTSLFDGLASVRLYNNHCRWSRYDSTSTTKPTEKQELRIANKFTCRISWHNQRRSALEFAPLLEQRKHTNTVGPQALSRD